MHDRPGGAASKGRLTNRSPRPYTRLTCEQQQLQSFLHETGVDPSRRHYKGCDCCDFRRRAHQLLQLAELRQIQLMRIDGKQLLHQLLKLQHLLPP